jgi:cytochrome c oxidase assembly protein subunit 15
MAVDAATHPTSARRRWSISPAAYRRATFAALLSLAAIIETGALVRLTDSGLGCEDWPNCSSTKLVDVSSRHAAIEQLNRLFTGVVAVAVIGAVLGSLLRQPRRRELTLLSLSLVAGVVGQIVLGGITVLTDLHPAAVQSHFLLSMLILAAAVVLHHRAGEADGPFVPTVALAVRRHVHAVVALVGVVLVTGTIVTGTGPHSGDEDARRFGFAITSVARVHGVSLLVLLAALLALAWLLRRVHPAAWPILSEPFTALLALAVVQGTIGYVQYLNDVPVVLVALHVAGAIAVWWATLRLELATRAPAPSLELSRDPSGRIASAPTAR